MNFAVSLEQVFSQRVFRIPDYQRGYAWDRRQLLDLREDLEALGQAKFHYTGTLVLCPSQDDRGRRLTVQEITGTTRTIYDVVDGQQRLTSLVILLNELQRGIRALPDGEVLANGIREKFVCGVRLDGQAHARLTLNEDCRDFFERDVLDFRPSAGGPVILSHRRLVGAKQFFTAWVRELVDGAPDEIAARTQLAKLYFKVKDQLRLGVYVLDDPGEVGVIFEVMNDRGKPLSNLEKVKNFLLYTGTRLDLAEHDLARQVNHGWKDILERLMAARLGRTTHEDSLLRFHWLACYNPDPKEWDGSRSIKARAHLKDWTGQHAELLEELLGYVSGLRDAAVVFTDSRNPWATDAFARWRDDPNRGAVQALSEKLLRLDAVANFTPLLIAARLAHPNDAEGYLGLLRACEVYAFRVYRVMQKRGDAGRNALYRLAHSVFQGHTALASARTEIDQIMRWYAGDDKFHAELEPVEEDDWYRFGATRYLLFEYEEHLAKGKATALDWWKKSRNAWALQIEHILPQTRSKAWKSVFSTAEHKAWVNDLGNLCLTWNNQSLSNKGFIEKKGKPGKGPGYVNSTLRQEQELAALESWDLDALTARRVRIVAWAKQRWARAS